MFHVFSDHDPSGNLFGPSQDLSKGQWGGKGPDQSSYDIPGDPNSVYFKDPSVGHTDIPGTSGADLETGRYRALADAAAGRAAPTTDYSQGDQYAGLGLAARTGQSNALSQINERAQGGGASAADLGTARGADQVAQGQIAAMAGARPNGQAYAGQQALTAGSAAQAQNMAQGGQARSAEISGAQSSLLGGYQSMRNSDLESMRMQDARSQHLANTIMNQHGLNQNTQMGFDSLGQGVEQEQLNNNIAWALQHNRDVSQQNNLNVASRNNADRSVDGVLGMGTTAMAAAAA